MTNKNLLKILFAEDLPSDADLAVLELKKEGLRFEHVRVDTRDGFVKALNEFKPDIIISDYMMPSYNGMLALIDAREFDPSIPFILCTGSMNEETAVECIKAGATDYVIKEHLTRLPFAVKEAIEQHSIQIEKRAADLLLKENEEKLQSIFRAAPVGIGLVVNREFMEVNDTFCAMTGYTRKELIGKSSELIYATKEEFKSVGIDKYGQIAEKGIGSVETRFKCKDGKIINILLSSTPLDKDDLTKGVTFTVLDITERKVVEIALHESEERFRILYNDAVVGLYRTNLQGEIFLANKTLVEMLGFQSFEELALRNLKETGYGPTYQRQKFINQIEKSGEVKDLEAVWVCRDGKEIFVRESARAVYDSDGKILYFDGTVQDITEQKKIAESLKEIQHLFQTLAQVSPVGIFRTDPEGNTTYVNPKWSELSGLSSEEALGAGWLKAVHPDDREKQTEIWSINLKSRNDSIAEYRFLKPDGSTVWVIGNAVPELIGNEVTGYIGTITDITERKITEEALGESERKYRQLVTQSPDGIFIIDLSGKFKSVNKAICEGLNFTEKELLTMNMLDIVPEQYHEMHKQRLIGIMNGVSPYSNAEYEVIGKNGITHFVEVLSVPYYIGKEIVGFQGIARDITERKRAEKVIRESEDKYRRIFDNVQDLYYETSIEGTILEVSPSIESLSKGQYHRDDLIGSSMYDFYPDPGERKALISKLIERGSVSGFEITLRNKDGSKVPCSLSSKIFLDSQGRPEKIIGSMHDISGRKSMEASIRESEERYRELFHNNPVPTYIFDIETFAFIEVNDATILSYGYSREEFAKMTLRDIRIEKDIPDLLESVKSLDSEAFHSRSMRHCRKDGTVFPVDIVSHELPEKNGKRSRLVMVNDITEQVRAEEKLKLAKEKAEASDKLKTTFLNNISHEVRTPLNGILGFAEIMSQADISEEEKRVSLSMLFESSDRLLDTITNYMDISLINSGTMSLYKKDFMPEQILRELYAKKVIICSARNLELYLEIPEQIEKLAICSDPEMLRKILTHLLMNAIKFTEKGSIKFGYIVHKDELEFFVKDSGIGIGRESLESVFEHFVKEDRGTLKLSEGSGLGLSISKGLAELLGGKIWVESEMGKGSTFFFTVPSGKDIEYNTSGPVKKNQKKTKRSKSILVAEDDTANFFYLNTLLRQNTAAEIIHASNGQEAVDKFQQHPDIGLILMDIKMPVMDGLEATRHIKAINRNVPVIAISAYAMAGDEARILDAGCDYYLVKPINKKLLLEKIAEYIEM